MQGNQEAAIYEEILRLSQALLDALRKQDIELAQELQERRAALLEDSNSEAIRPDALGGDYLRRLIGEIQKCDAQALAYASPWRDHMAALLGKNTSGSPSLP